MISCAMPTMAHAKGNMTKPKMMQKRRQQLQNMELYLAKTESILEHIPGAQKSKKQVSEENLFRYQQKLFSDLFFSA